MINSCLKEISYSVFEALAGLTGYDGEAVRIDAPPCIWVHPYSSCSNKKTPHNNDEHLYEERHVIKCFSINANISDVSPRDWIKASSFMRLLP